MSIYTKRGDRGITDMAHVGNISKSDDRIRLMGEADELNSHIELVKSMLRQSEILQFLERIQKNLDLIAAGVSVVNLGDGAVVADHSVVGIDTCDHKAGNHEHHGNEHQPALVIAEQLKKHEISLWIKQKCGLPHKAAGPLCAHDKR